jgi:MFS family permease
VSTFRALRHPPYRAYWLGMLVSLVGTWMQSTAQSFLVYELTGSALRTGFVMFAFSLPSLLFALPGGAVADRWDRRKLLILTQGAFAASAALLSALTFARAVRFEVILALACWSGVVMAIDAPTRQALVPTLVEREDLVNAIALNSAAFNGSRIFGPALAGLIYQAAGPAWCFLLNALSYLAVIVPVWRMRIRSEPEEAQAAPVLEEIRDGVRYVRARPVVSSLLLLLAAVGTFGYSWAVVMPAFAVRVLHGGAATNGLLLTAVGVGATAGALWIASVRSLRRPGRIVLGCAAATGVALVAFSLTRTLPAALVGIGAVGFFLIAYMSATNTTIQSLVDDRYRGRVMSLYTLALIGSGPLGSLLAGGLADAIGVGPSLGLLGALVVGSAGAILWGVPSLLRLDGATLAHLTARPVRPREVPGAPTTGSARWPV